jgi:hypothetical protein
MKVMDDELIDLNVRYVKEPEPVLPEGTTAKQALEMVYRGLIELTPQQMRAAIELLPYENPKLSATAIATMDGNSFAEALERAITRSKSQPPEPKLIEAQPLPAEDLKRPMAHYRNNFRRY